MAAVLSSYTYSLKSEQGSPIVHGVLVIELRHAGYEPNGEGVDLRPYFRHVNGAWFSPISGQIADKVFEMNDADLSGSLGLASARIKVWRPAGSGAVMGEVLSGTAVSGNRAIAFIVGY